jgi:glycosyltransferase involved in cell wall biosynthesis
MEKTCLIIPCYNESNRLDTHSYLKELSNNPNLTLIFVNDGSNDSTIDVLRQLHSNCDSKIQNRIHILSYSENQGKATAVQRGLLWAYAMSNNNTIPSFLHACETIGNEIIDAKYFGFWDADLATPLSELSWFFHLAIDTNPDMIIGSRVARLGSNIERTVFRHYSGRLFATLISQGLGWKVHDTQCGAKIFKSHLIPICMGQSFKTSWLFDVEMLLRMKKNFGENAINMILEAPIRNWKDVKGSKIGWADFVKVPYQIWKVFRDYK